MACYKTIERLNMGKENSDGSPEVFVSYAWEAESEQVVAKFEHECITNGILLKRDITDIGFKGLISSFMKQLGNGKCVVLIISDKYLKSENCMFELLEVVAHGDFYNRVFPIVLDSARFYRPIDRIQYIKYWEKMAEDLNASMTTLTSQANLHGIRESLDRYTLYRASVAELTSLLSDMNNFSVESHFANSFKEIFQLVFRRFPNDGYVSNETSVPFFILDNQYSSELAAISPGSLQQDIQSKAYWIFKLRPTSHVVHKSLDLLKSAIVESSTGRAWGFPRIPNSRLDEERIRNGTNFVEALSNLGDRKEFWRIYKSGQYVNYRGLAEDWYGISRFRQDLSEEVKPYTVVNLYDSILFYITDCLEFTTRMCKRNLLGEEVLISFALHNVLDRELRVDDSRREPFNEPRVTGENVIFVEKKVSVESLLSDFMRISNEVVMEVLEAFGYVPESAIILELQNKYLRS